VDLPEPEGAEMRNKMPAKTVFFSLQPVATG
jgi:hypothetical protein